MNFRIDNISKYRTHLMGYAILGVMLAHIKTICEMPDSIASTLLGVFCYSIFTGGFVLLSGLGLYRSLSNPNELKHYYLKRFVRLLLPYWIISLPYFFYTDIFLHNDWLAFFLHYSTLSFWLSGNYSGMWYISLIIVLYAIYPFLHIFLYSDNSLKYYRLALIISICGIGILLISLIYPHYFDLISVGVSKIPLFVMGSFLMSLIMSKSPQRCGLIVVFSCCISVFFCILADSGNIWLLVNVFSIIIVSNLFDYCSKRKNVEFVLNLLEWLGKYTLELYIIHLLLFYFFNVVDTTYSQGLHILFAVLISIMICKPIHQSITFLSNVLFYSKTRTS